MYRKCQYDTKEFNIFESKNKKIYSNIYETYDVGETIKNIFKYKYFYLSRFYLKT